MKEHNKEEKNWRVVARTTLYSKKSGTRQVNIPRLVDSTYQECLDYLAKEYPNGRLVNNEMTVKGFLHPTYISIKYLKSKKAL